MNFLLKHLLHWFLFSGILMFAAGAVADAGAIDGGSGENADAGAGAGDAELGDDGSDRDGAGGGDGSQHDGADSGESASADKGDSRTLPKNIQGALKSLKEAHPELAKELEELRKGYFDSRGHREFFKNPAEARQAKATLDLVGGSQGIANLQSQVAAIEMVDGALEAGDPQVLDDMFSDFGDGMKKLAPEYLARLDKLDPQACGAAVQPFTYRALETAELGPRLSEAFAAIEANKPDEAKTLLKNIYRWLEGQKQLADQRKTEDPERAKFKTEVDKFNQTKEQTFRQDIGRQTVAHQSQQISSALAPYLKTRALPAEAKQDLADGVNAEVNRLLRADKNYQDQVKALLASRTRDQAGIVRYINSVVAEVAPKAVRTVWTRRYGSLPASRPAAAAAGADKSKAGAVKQNPAGSSAPVKLAAKPKREDVDWSKTKDIMYITNKAVMKNGPHKGKLVTW